LFKILLFHRYRNFVQNLNAYTPLETVIKRTWPRRLASNSRQNTGKKSKNIQGGMTSPQLTHSAATSMEQHTWLRLSCDVWWLFPIYYS